jgi:hypothetical protein
MLSPIFPSLLTFIILIVYKIYFDPVILCDNGCSPLFLQQLKANYDEELQVSSQISKNILDFSKTIQEKEALGEVNSAQRAYIKVILNGYEDMYIKSLTKSRDLAESIKKIEPTFKTRVDDTNANILRVLQEYRRR